MDIGNLLQFGFNKNEAKVYLALLKLGSASAGELIKNTGFHRNIVYDNLEKLIDKGLVTFILEGKKKIFQPAKPEMLSELLDKEQATLDQKKKLAQSLQQEIAQLQKTSKEGQESIIFRGMNGLKALFRDTLEHGTDYYVLGAPRESLDIMGSTFWQNYNLKRMEKKIVVKMLFNDDLREWSNVIRNKITEIRFLPKEFHPLSETVIYGDKIALIVWTEKPIATLIQDKNLAESYKQYFKYLWDLANP